MDAWLSHLHVDAWTCAGFRIRTRRKPKRARGLSSCRWAGARAGWSRGSQPAAPQAAKGLPAAWPRDLGQDSRRLVRDAGARAPLSWARRAPAGRRVQTQPDVPGAWHAGRVCTICQPRVRGWDGACFHGLRALLDPLSPRVPPSHPWS